MTKKQNTLITTTTPMLFSLGLLYYYLYSVDRTGFIFWLGFVESNQMKRGHQLPILRHSSGKLPKHVYQQNNTAVSATNR